MNVKIALSGVVLAAIAGAVLTKHFCPTIQTVDKVQTKDKIVTIVKEIRSKDGTVEIDTTKTEDQTVAEKKTETVQKQTPNWHVSGGAGIDISKGLSGPVYAVDVQKRVLGPIFVGVQGQTNGYVGINLGVEF